MPMSSKKCYLAQLFDYDAGQDISFLIAVGYDAEHMNHRLDVNID